MKEKSWEGGKAYEDLPSITSGTSAPPNPFFRALCSTSDPAREAPSAWPGKLAPTRSLGRPGTLALSDSPVMCSRSQTRCRRRTAPPASAINWRGTHVHSGSPPGRSRNGHRGRSSPGLEHNLSSHPTKIRESKRMLKNRYEEG
jgi:hypothetical protein